MKRKKRGKANDTVKWGKRKEGKGKWKNKMGREMNN